MTPKLTQEHTLYDSPEELHFSYWLDELKEEGYIIEWFREVAPYSMTDGLKHSYTVEEVLKTKTRSKVVTQTLLRPSEYTPDFKILWSDTSDNIFFQTLEHKCKLTAPFIASVFEGCPISIVEIKPDFDYNNMTRLFTLNQKFVWDKYQEYINVVKVSELFSKTFTPTAFMFTKTGKPRKLKWKAVNIGNYIKNSL